MSENYDPDKKKRSCSAPKSKHNCVIHYNGIQFTDNLISVNETRYEELVAIRECRIQLGDKFIHTEQSSRIPNSFQDGLHYHRECYANFSRARSELKKRIPLSETQNKELKGIERSHRSKELDSLGKFPEYCWFCKSSKTKRIRSRGREIHERVKGASNSIKETLVAAAKKRGDSTLLCCIEDVDLQQKGFKKHSSCYADYTTPLYDRETNTQVEPDTAVMEKIKEVIVEKVIIERKCMPLDEILDLKGEKLKNTTHDKI